MRESLSVWESTGKVNANNGASVLSEVTTSQTRLNQVFMVGADGSRTNVVDSV